MVLRSQARGGRNSVTIGNPAEIPVSVYARESGLSATGPTVAETLSEAVSKQTCTYQAKQQNNSIPDFHTYTGSNLDFHTGSTRRD